MRTSDGHRELGFAGAASALRIDTIQGDLAGRRLGVKLHYFSQVDSTNTVARQLAENGASEGEIVIAEEQSCGRGRLGRSWISPPFVNLYLSIILRPKLAPQEAPQITLTAAVALADAVAAFIPEAPSIKWPNDILFRGKKLAGVLTESSISSDRVHYVILGIGVNVNFSTASMPESLRSRATSLMDCAGYGVTREAFLLRLIQDLDRCYGILGEAGFDSILPRWEARFNFHGKRVRVETDGTAFAGIARGIDGSGALMVEDKNGRLHRVTAGDVIPLDA